ncbi:MAG: hypothetical protein PHR78_01110 [Eubacteriales bacterium]|nr:hypothetical protein [Eubacteriales bacterium]MDD4323610.1 hypothetical protein [Eubacteriales bacterium]MDD4540756.1 hypothetical protein [Eubacteriales bacterium]
MTKLKCPHCGMTDVIDLLPLSTDLLWERLAEDEIKYRYYCSSCDKYFGATAYTKDGRQVIPYISGLCFYAGNYYKGFSQINFRRHYPNCCTYKICMCKDDTHEETLGRRPCGELSALIDSLYYNLFLDDWLETYNSVRSEDGTYWKLIVYIEDEEKREYSGTQEHPAYWKELMDLFQPYFDSMGRKCSPSTMK